MKTILAVSLLLVTAHAASGALPVVGGPAPEITLDRLLPEQPVANAKLRALAGKAVVLEFWGTWCEGCVTAIAHLNQLAEQFQGQRIVFLSVTEEEPALVEEFLRKNPIRGWVGFAHRARLFQDYGVEPLPRTFLIDAAGKIAAVTRPEKVTAPVLADLLAGRPIGVPTVPISSTGRGEASGVKPLLDMIIRPTSDAGVGRGRLEGEEATLRSIISRAFGYFPEDRIEGEPLADRAKYDFSFSLPGAKWEEFQALAQQLVCAAFQVKVERVRREREVLVLTAPEGKSSALVPNSRGGSLAIRTGRGYFKMVNNGTIGIALFLTRELHRDIVDETGLTGRYDFELKWDPGSEQSLREALRRQLGLQLESARRPLEYLLVARVQ